MATGENAPSTDGQEEDTTQFVFENWAEDAELNRKTVKYLRGEQLVSVRTLSLIEDRDMVMMPLPLGQRKLLKAAVAELCTTQTIAAIPEGDPPRQNMDHGTPIADTTQVTLDTLRRAPDILINAGKTFDEIFDDQHDSQHITGAGQVQFDPRSILTVKASKTKPLHITEFITEKTKRRRHARKREIVLSTGGSNQDRIVFKTDEDHPYSGILIEEWGAANCRVMNALLSKGILRRENVEYYLAYTAKIFEFASRYEWENVLDYDHQYRELQAEHDFHWGVTPPDMELRFLTRQNGAKLQPTFPRRYRAGDSQTPGQNVSYSGGYTTNGPAQDCKIFKARGYCPFGAACRYKHPPKQHQQNLLQTSPGSPPAKNGSM